MKLYLAGPMRGIKDFNFPAFDLAADVLRSYGYEVFNPADRDREKHGAGVGISPTGDLKDVAHTGFNHRETMTHDLQWIAAEADGIATLPGWQDSKGAQAEIALALAIGIEVLSIPGWVGDAAPDPFAAVNLSGEVRTVSSTGGEKGVKPARFDLIPTGPLATLATHYGLGAAKYADNNWARGYKWSNSYAALQRHANAFWSGEEVDEESGSPHLAAVAFHAFSLLHFSADPQYADFDDRLSTHGP